MSNAQITGAVVTRIFDSTNDMKASTELSAGMPCFSSGRVCQRWDHQSMSEKDSGKQENRSTASFPSPEILRV